MISRLQGPYRRWGHPTLVIVLTVFIAGACLLWAWNAIAIELFGAPAIGFKHVVAFQAAIAALTALPLVVARALRRQ